MLGAASEHDAKACVPLKHRALLASSGAHREREQALTPEGGRGRFNLRPKRWLHGAPSESALIDEFSSTGS